MWLTKCMENNIICHISLKDYELKGDSYIESLYSRIDRYHIGITKQPVSKYEICNAILFIGKNKRTSRREIGNVMSF